MVLLLMVDPAAILIRLASGVLNHVHQHPSLGHGQGAIGSTGVIMKNICRDSLGPFQEERRPITSVLRRHHVSSKTMAKFRQSISHLEDFTRFSICFCQEKREMCKRIWEAQRQLRFIQGKLVRMKSSGLNQTFKKMLATTCSLYS